MESSEDGWVFDSLVNFLHGPVWKLPVMGFIEEKSVVFDPDSYNNLTDDKESEYRTIHEEYKALVDYMLTNFMEDIQVSPEQVEEACRLREQQNKSRNLPESHITKVALEQLWAAEDFGAFRRLMTRKNIDLQLQSLELLVAKYGVLSPALRPATSEEESEANGEEDFLQVVIRYTEPDAVFHSSLFNVSKNKKSKEPQPQERRPLSCQSPSSSQANPNATCAVFGKACTPAQSVEGAEPPSPVVNVDSSICSPVRDNAPQVDQSPSSQSVTPPSCMSPVVTVVSVHEPSAQNAEPETPKRQIMQQEEEELQIFNPISIADVHNSAEADSNKEIDSAVPEPDNSDDTETEALQAPSQDSEMVQGAPEQHRILSAVRRALDETSEADDKVDTSALDLLHASKGTPEQVERRREYLKAQRDKLVALKKRERQKHFQSIDVQSTAEKAEGRSLPARPKSARAAQLAVDSPETVVGSGTSEKSLQARRALAQRLKQELLAEK